MAGIGTYGTSLESPRSQIQRYCYTADVQIQTTNSQNRLWLVLRLEAWTLDKSRVCSDLNTVASQDHTSLPTKTLMQCNLKCKGIPKVCRRCIVCNGEEKSKNIPTSPCIKRANDSSPTRYLSGTLLVHRSIAPFVLHFMSLHFLLLCCTSQCEEKPYPDGLLVSLQGYPIFLYQTRVSLEVSTLFRQYLIDG